MKKLLIFMIPVLLFFGVSLGDTFDFTFDGAGSASNAVKYYGQRFNINGKSGNVINLAQILPYDISSSTCHTYTIGSIHETTNLFTVIATGDLNGVTGLTNVNVDLSPGMYGIFIHSGTTACNSSRGASTKYYYSGFISAPSLGYSSATALPTGLIVNNSSLGPIKSFIFSGTNPTIFTCNNTIHYNGILTTGGTTDIYLNGITSTPSYSGGMIVFTYLQNIFRALFRSALP